MTDSNKYSNIEVDTDYLDYLGDEAQRLQEEYNQEQERKKAVAEEQAAATAKADAEQYDPRNADTWGAKALIKEGQSILSGGLQDTASSIATFPERTVDAITGEMQRQRDATGTYTPDFTPFGAYDNPIETKTWWGKQLRGLVHFGSLAAGTVLAAKEQQLQV